MNFSGWGGHLARQPSIAGYNRGRDARATLNIEFIPNLSRPRSCDPPPTGPSELSFLSVDTRTPYVADFPGEDGGKTAHYMLRWVATTGEKGPWSETATATIGA